MRANRIAVALMPDELERDPVIGGLRFVEQDVCGAAIGGDHCIHEAIVVDVADRHTAANPGIVKNLRRDSGDIDELVAGLAHEHYRLPVVKLREALLDGVEIMALCN